MGTGSQLYETKRVPEISCTIIWVYLTLLNCMVFKNRIVSLKRERQILCYVYSRKIKIYGVIRGYKEPVTPEIAGTL